MDGDQKTDQQWVYQIKVQGRLQANWSGWFDGLALTTEGDEDTAITTLTGVVADQAALRGLLTKLWNLNLSLISVVRLDRH
jgi:hypothetical protein